MLDFETLPIVTWQEVLEYKEQNPLSDEIRKKVEIQGQVLLDKKTLKEHSNRKIIKHKKIMKIRKKL